MKKAKLKSHPVQAGWVPDAGRKPKGTAGPYPVSMAWSD